MKLLLLHPLPFDGSVFSDETRRLVDECHAPTLYRHGSDIEAWARAALDVVGADPLVVVGNSIGGSVAIEVTRLAPAQVKALVLVGAKPGHRPEPGFRDEALRCLEQDGLRAAWDRYWLPLFGPSISAAVLEKAWQTVSRVGVNAVATGVRAFHSRTDRDAFLKTWTGPVWIVSGEHDTAPRPLHHLAERLPNGRLRLVPDAGHYVPLEQPAALDSTIEEALAVASCEDPAVTNGDGSWLGEP